MKRRRLIAVADVWGLSTVGTTKAQERNPGNTYLELIAASRKATSFDQIASFLSSDLLREIEAQPPKPGGVVHVREGHLEFDRRKVHEGIDVG